VELEEIVEKARKLVEEGRELEKYARKMAIDRDVLVRDDDARWFSKVADLSFRLRELFEEAGKKVGDEYNAWASFADRLEEAAADIERDARTCVEREGRDCCKVAITIRKANEVYELATGKREKRCTCLLDDVVGYRRYSLSDAALDMLFCLDAALSAAEGLAKKLSK